MGSKATLGGCDRTKTMGSEVSVIYILKWRRSSAIPPGQGTDAPALCQGQRFFFSCLLQHKENVFQAPAVLLWVPKGLWEREGQWAILPPTGGPSLPARTVQGRSPLQATHLGFACGHRISKSSSSSSYGSRHLVIMWIGSLHVSQRFGVFFSL